MIVLTRDEAKFLGSARYFTGAPCKHGHICPRNTCDRGCIKCRVKKSQRVYWSNPEPHKEYRKLEYLTMPEDKRKILLAESRARSRAWRKNNPGHRNHLKAMYVAARNKRTPAWAEVEKISAFYRACPKGFHVDHIIPLRGQNVSGLHVHDNLQYLPAIENMRKHNTWEDK